jgi:hypothetical protein
MKKINLVKRLLWAFNIVLAAALLMYLFNFIVFPREKDYLEGLPPRGDVTSISKTSHVEPIYTESFYDTITNFPNPMDVKKQKVEPKPIHSELSQYIDIHATMPPNSAFLKRKRDNSIILAYCQEEIKDSKGEIVPELKGVRIIEVYFDHVIFNNNGVRETLNAPATKILGSSSSPTGPTVSPASDYRKFKSNLLIATGDRSVWAIDQEEIEYVQRNQDTILNNEVTLSFLPTGGVKIDSIKEDSIIKARGFQQGDIIKTINGRQVTAENAKDLPNDPVIKDARTITVVFDRWGKQKIIEFRPRQ